LKLLVVDHSKVFRAVWQRLMRRDGHEPLICGDGDSGLATVESERVDMICVSLSLPDIDGIEFTRRCRKLPQGKNVPIILLTSVGDKEVRRRAFEAGVTDIHAKTDIQQLFNRARRFISDDPDSSNPPSGCVLYVEDSRTVSRIMIHVLGKMNLEVDHFRSAADAWEHFDEERHDLVISDILVEGEMSGVALVNRLRERYPDKTRLPILAMSGMEDPVRRVELFRLGVNDFINKPVIIEEARARISNLIVNKQLFDQVQQQRRQLYELAMTDPLTGLQNRNALTDFSRQDDRSRGEDGALGLIMIDIDHFKQINDRHGHLVGDEVLGEIGELLTSSCRDDDFAVRFGGEELLLVLPGCPLEAATRRAEELRLALEVLEPGGLHVTASMGVSAIGPDSGIDIEEAIRIADQAVYRAKAQGRNQVVTIAADTGNGNGDSGPVPATGSDR
jgi:two-component system cell cycle response regulator